MSEIDNIKCDHCGHSVQLHNSFNCIYAFEKPNECGCPLGKEHVKARWWARLFYKRAVKAEHERDEMKKVLEREDVQRYLAWWNANRND